jgi:hypothetical protein
MLGVLRQWGSRQLLSGSSFATGIVAIARRTIQET